MIGQVDARRDSSLCEAGRDRRHAVTETIHTYPRPHTPGEGFEGDVTFSHYLWPPTLTDVATESPRTAQYLKDLFDLSNQQYGWASTHILSTPSKYDRVADMQVAIYPTLDASTAIVDFHVLLETNIQWQEPGDLARYHGLDDRQRKELEEWYEEDGPHTVNGDAGVTCREDFRVTTLSELHARIVKEVEECELAAEEAWGTIEGKIQEILGAKPRRDHADKASGRRRRRRDVL